MKEGFCEHKIENAAKMARSIQVFLWTLLERNKVYLKDLPVELPMSADEALSISMFHADELERLTKYVKI